MKLFYAPGACSMACHIALREAGLPFTLERVEFGNPHKIEHGQELRAINPKGAVPVLALDDGQLLTECAVILQFVADKAPEAGLAPPAGTLPRYRLMELLNFIGTELHKVCFAPLFSPATPADYKPVALAYLEPRLVFLEAHTTADGFLTGPSFTVADAYAFTVLSWTNPLKIDLGKWPKLNALVGRIAARPSVQQTLKAEGLAA